MKKLAPLLIVAACSLSCGGGGGGKPIADKGEAADATYNLVTAKQDLEGRSSSSLAPAQVGGVDVEADVTVRGETGSAKISTSTEVQEGRVRVQYRVVYDGYSPDGINTFDGDVTYLTEVRSDASGVSVIEEVNGSAQISGEYAASLAIDARMAIVVDGSNVSIEITGTIEADGSLFTYDGEVIGLRGDGSIDVEVNPNDPRDPQDPADPADCSGTYVGTYTGTDSGIVEGIAADGTFRVTFTSDLGSEVELVYSIDAEGRVGGSSFGISVDASLEAQPCLIRGTWASATGGGTWEARLQ